MNPVVNLDFEKLLIFFSIFDIEKLTKWVLNEESFMKFGTLVDFSNVYLMKKNSFRLKNTYF